MQKDQKAIYYITGGREAGLRNSPLLETYKARGLEVLVMDDEIDEIVASSIGKFMDIDLKAVNRSATADDLKTEEDAGKAAAIEPLLAKVKKALGDQVKDVRASSRLADSPSCIVVDEHDPTMQMQQILKMMGNKDLPGGEADPGDQPVPPHRHQARRGAGRVGDRRHEPPPPGPGAAGGRRGAQGPCGVREAPEQGAGEVSVGVAARARVGSRRTARGAWLSPTRRDPRRDASCPREGSP